MIQFCLFFSTVEYKNLIVGKEVDHKVNVGDNIVHTHTHTIREYNSERVRGSNTFLYGDKKKESMVDQNGQRNKRRVSFFFVLCRI